MDNIDYLMSEVKKKHDRVEALVNATKPLVGKTSQRTTLYMQYLEAACRRNYYSLFSLYHLSDIQLVWFGSAALDLSRQMIEDMISIEWMELKDAEEQAKKIKRFEAVERHNNLQQSKYIGIDPANDLDQKTINQIEHEFEHVKAEFSKKNGDLFHNYNHQSVETMIKELEGKIDASILTKDDINRIKYWYLEGNKKNHFNADDITMYLEPEIERDTQFARQLERSLFIGLNTFSQICLRYIDEVIKSDGGIPNVKEIRKTVIQLSDDN